MRDGTPPSLDELGLLGPGSVPELDSLTALARTIFEASVSLVSLVQPELDRQFFTSSNGLDEPWQSSRQTSLSHSFCKHVVADDRELAVVDAHNDPVVAGNGAIEDLDVIAYLGVPVYKDEAGPVGALCVIDDKPRAWSEVEIDTLRRLGACVTEAIKARAAALNQTETMRRLQQLQDRLDDAITAGGVGLWERDLDTGEFWLSEKYTELHGGSTADWTGLESLIDRFHPEDRRTLEARMLSEREPNRTYEWVYRFRMDDDSYRWMRSTSMLSERPGLDARLAGATVDITADREREVRLAAANAQLADTNDSLNEFVRIASHDLRSPLRQIRTLIGLIKSDHPDAPERVRRDLDALDGRAEHLTDLLDDMFKYLVVGTTEPESAIVDLSVLTRQVFALVDRPDHIELEVEASVVSARLDGFALGTVIRNLVDNAVKHSRDRPGRVHVAFSTSPSDDDALVIEIGDTGPGIPAAHIGRIFEPFYTLDQPSGVPSTGMGLAIVRRLLQRARGTVEVTSEVGRGSTFRLTWPATEIRPLPDHPSPGDE